MALKKTAGKYVHRMRQTSGLMLSHYTILRKMQLDEKVGPPTGKLTLINACVTMTQKESDAFNQRYFNFSKRTHQN